MSKLGFVLGSVFTLFMITLIVNEMGLGNITFLENMETEIPQGASGLFSFIGTFASILTFQVDDLPLVFNIIFLMITIGLMYVIIDWVKDVIPFT